MSCEDLSSLEDDKKDAALCTSKEGTTSAGVKEVHENEVIAGDGEEEIVSELV